MARILKYCLTAIVFIPLLISCSDSVGNSLSISRVDVLYVEHWYMTTTLPLSCEILKQKGEFPSHAVSISDIAALREWVNVLDSLNLVPWEGSFSGDCRVCCLLYDRNDSITKSIALWPTGLKIGASVYQFDSTLMRLVSSHLPDDYFEKLRVTDEQTNPETD